MESHWSKIEVNTNVLCVDSYRCCGHSSYAVSPYYINILDEIVVLFCYDSIIKWMSLKKSSLFGLSERCHFVTSTTASNIQNCQFIKTYS